MTDHILFSDEGICNQFLYNIDDEDCCLLIVDSDVQHTELFIMGYEVESYMKSILKKKNVSVTVFIAAGQFHNDDKTEKSED